MYSCIPSELVCFARKWYRTIDNIGEAILSIYVHSPSP